MKKLSNFPRHIRSDVWYYETRKGLDFVIEDRDSHGNKSARQFTIDFRTLESYLRRRKVEAKPK